MQKKLDLILHGYDDLAEVITIDELRSALKNEDCSSLWGIEPLKVLHLGYDRIIVKQRDLIKAGLKHKILIADVHAMLDNPGAENLFMRTQYVTSYLRDLCGLERAKFVLGSNFQHSDPYIDLLYNVLSVTGVSTVRMELARKKATIGNLIYPIMQALDGVSLETNIVFGGTDQRGTYMMAREILHKMGYKKPAVLLSYLSQDIKGELLKNSKMETRITIHDNRQTLKNKVNKMYAPKTQTENNPLLEHFKFSILPWFDGVNVKLTDGSQMKIEDFKELEKLYSINKIGVEDLKDVAFEYLWLRLRKIQAYFHSRPKLIEWIDFKRINPISFKR